MGPKYYPMEENSVRDSRSQMFFKIGVPRHFAIFTGNHLCWSIFFNKVVGLKAVWQKTGCSVQFNTF